MFFSRSVYEIPDEAGQGAKDKAIGVAVQREAASRLVSGPSSWVRPLVVKAATRPALPIRLSYGDAGANNCPRDIGQHIAASAQNICYIDHLLDRCYSRDVEIFPEDCNRIEGRRSLCRKSRMGLIDVGS